MQISLHLLHYPKLSGSEVVQLPWPTRPPVPSNPPCSCYSLNVLSYRASLMAQSVKNLPACNAGDPGSIPGSGRSPGEENNNPLQYSCLENPMDRGAWQATYSPWVTKRMTQWLNEWNERTMPHLSSQSAASEYLSCFHFLVITPSAYYESSSYRSFDEHSYSYIPGWKYWFICYICSDLVDFAK